MKMINQDTICAIATAQGGAIGIIRVSGPKAIEITSRIFTPATGKPLTERRFILYPAASYTTPDL